MSDFFYSAGLMLDVRKSDNAKPEVLRFPVQAFQVTGGAHRKIEIDSTNEGAIGAEFEQARIYENVILFIKQGADSPTAELIKLAKSGRKGFLMNFVVSVFDKAKRIRRYDLTSYKTSLAGVPVPVGATPAQFKAKMLLNAPEVWHGKRDEKLDGIISEKV